ncbi:MAG: hypothetical protein RIR51_488 [Bacteroidota bacterium]|jgi:kynurenine formamidase
MKKRHLLYLIAIYLFSNCSPQKTPNFTNLVDLTHPFDENTIYWPNDTNKFLHPQNFYGETEKGYFYSSFGFSSPEHGGTHLDAPIHFAANHLTIDEIPLKNLIGMGVKLDLRKEVMGNPDYQISIQDIKEWEKMNGEIPTGSIVLFETGWSDYYQDYAKYLGTSLKGEQALADLHFPGIEPQTAQWLIENRQISAAGLDTPSLDYGQSKYFESHQILLGNNIPGFENLTNLKEVPSKNFLVMALPMKIKGGSGGPLRIVTGVLN